MKALEMNEKSRIKSRGVLTKVLICQLLSAIEYQTSYQLNALRKHFYPMVRYTIYMICISSILTKSLDRNEKTLLELIVVNQ